MAKTYNYQPAGTFTVTTTGNIDDLDFQGCATILMNNASLATIRGLKAGYPGQTVQVIHINSSLVLFNHQDTNSAAANRLINGALTHTFPILPGGTSTWRYDDVTARWRCVAHAQGGPLAYLTYPGYTAGDFTESGGGTWTVDNPGDVQGLSYLIEAVSGTMDVGYSIINTSVGVASQALSWKLPFSLTTPATVVTGYCRAVDAGTTVTGFSRTIAAGTTLDFLRQDVANFAISTNTTSVQGIARFGIQ